MRLIGAGLPRTATLSQKIGLEMLGLGPCYHMVEVLSDLDRVDAWADALEGHARWDEIFGGFEACVDWPSSFFYEELMEAYPEAKVLLSVRSGDSWAKSMAETICDVLYGDTLMRDLSSARAKVDRAWDGYIELMRQMWDKSGLLPAGADVTESTLAAGMERYNAEVVRTVPEDRLIVWSPEKGYGPICQSFGLPLPEAPFPRVNDTATFTERIVASALGVLNAWHEQQAPAVH